MMGLPSMATPAAHEDEMVLGASQTNEHKVIGATL
jgi:hypothetical protein